MNNLAKLNPDTPPVETWPEPQALTGPELEREPYPCDALPAGLRAAIDDVAATTQAPFAMCATSALAALSVAGQGHIDVQRNNQLKGPTSLFALIIAESGERKSTVDKFFTRAILRYEKEQAEVMKPEIKKYTAELMAWTAKKNGIQESIKYAAKNAQPTLEDTNRLIEIEAGQPIAPKVPTFIFGDATPEALIYELHKNWPSGGVISSEGGTVFGSHGMSADTVMRNLATQNILWDGGELKISRKTSESFTIRGARLTVCVAVQHPVLAEFLAKAGDIARGSGFLARFLVAWPESTQGNRPYIEPSGTLRGLDAYDARITALLNQQLNFDETGNGLEPQLLTLSSGAKKYWVDFYNLIEKEIKSTGTLATVKDVASKVADNGARLSGLFHCYEYGLDGQISVESMQAACNIVMWHLNESRRLLGELAQDPAISMAAKLDGWLIARCNVRGTNQILLREILQGGPNILRDKRKLEPILDELIDSDRARRVKTGRKELVYVNPALLIGGV